MTRLDAYKEMAHIVKDELPLFTGKEFIDKIYDDFESRTCSNCHYYTGTVCYYHEGWNDEVGVVHPNMLETDCCNRWLQQIGEE